MFSALRRDHVKPVFAANIKMNAQYSGFNLYGGCAPISETVLGR
jgi:hypothetical protein